MMKWLNIMATDNMKRSDRPPDYLIDAIARHVRTLLSAPQESNKYKNAERLVKKEIRKLETYKSK